MFLGLVLPILLFFVGLNFVYAYFTASANPTNSNGVTGIIRVGFTDNTTTKEINSASIGDSTKLVPGDVLSISGAVENKGTAPIYAVLNFEIKITKSDSSTETISRFYTMKDTTLTTLTGNESNLLPISASGVENEYLQTAFYLNEPTQEEGEDPVYDFSPFKLTYTFDGNTYDNSYQDALVEYRATAYAIQTVNLTEDATKAPMVATQLLLQDKDYKSYVVMGNSYQATTPTVTSPVEVQSFGDKTKNLLDYKAFIISGKTKEIENGIQFEKTGGRIDIGTSFTFKANTTYVLSAECTGDGYLGGRFNNNFSGFVWCDKNTKSLVIKNLTDADVTESIRYVDTAGTKGSTIKFAMLEINSSATEYEPYGYKIEYTKTSKNLFDLNNALKIDNWLKGDSYNYLPITLEVGKTYTISAENTIVGISNVNLRLGRYNSSTDKFTSLQHFLSSSTIECESRQYTFTADGTECLYSYSPGWLDQNELNVLLNDYVINIQIEEGDAATEYASYHENSTGVIYLNEPLRKVGDVADYIDFNAGVVVRRIKTGIINSDTSFGRFSGVTDYSAFYITKTDLIDVSTSSVYSFAVLSDKFTGTAASGANTNKNWSAAYQISASISPTYKRICFTLEANIDIDAAKEWLAENIITYYYPTKTPILEIINLSDLGDYNEGTTFTFNTEIQPSDIAIDA